MGSSIVNRTPHKQLFLRVGRYSVKIAETENELRQLYRLRYKVFHGSVKAFFRPFALDSTDYEAGADHLIVKDGDQVVGTYRLRCSKFCDGFFSSSEFDISDFLAKSRGKTLLELGRACVAPDKRTGAVFIALLKGIVNYAKLVGADYLFGCTSVFSKDPRDAVGVFQHLKAAGAVSHDFQIKPLPGFKVQGFKTLPPREDAAEIVPSLLSAYLKMGTKIYGEPAYDAELKCFDFLTIIDFTALDPTYLRKLS